VFDRVLIANRGEIAVRITRTLRRLNIESVAVFSDADADAVHVRGADISARLGPAEPAQSYLSIDRVIEAAVASGAQAVHPGYGFLAENAAFASACTDAGLVFVGPPADVIATMGDKVRAKAVVAAAGVAVVPGSEGHGLDDDQLARFATELGFPVLLKPSAGGGGKGMRVVTAAPELAEAIGAARREARAAFGDDTLLVERFVDSPRHIEIQVMADGDGRVVHLGERECSLQRRHQKIVEEAPSPALDPSTRAAMGDAAVAVARSCGYVGAGTVEFVVSSERPDDFFFMEMNTRLQVEHPVTEMIYGIDLVEAQLRVADGEALWFTQSDLVPRGHAVEARIYAEDPSTGFLPTGGRVLAVVEPDGHTGIRVDSALATGTVVGSDYDPMLAKVVAHGADRAQALDRLDAALADTSVLGVTTNIGFLRDLLALPDVQAGRLDTALVERAVGSLVPTEAPLPLPAVVAATLGRLRAPTTSTDPWELRTGWAQGGPRAMVCTVEARGHTPVTVVSRHTTTGWSMTIDGTPVAAGEVAPTDDAEFAVTVDGQPHTLRSAVDADGDWWWSSGGRVWVTRVAEPWESGPGTRTTVHRGPVVAPMPGTLTALLVAVGDPVVVGQALALVEAMKMEFTLRAPHDGVVAEVFGPSGRAVALGEAVLVVDPDAVHPDPVGADAADDGPVDASARG